MRTTLSSGANLLAFASRLTNTCVSRGPSPSTFGRSSGSVELEALATLLQQRADQRVRVFDRPPRSPRSDDGCRAGPIRCARFPAGCRSAASGAACRAPATAPAPSAARAACVSRPSRSSSIDASCAASGVRNSCEMFASTESRARRTPSSSVSSRMTCTCSSSTGAALVMIVVRGAPSLEVQAARSPARCLRCARAGSDSASRTAADRSPGTASARRRRTDRSPRAPARRAVARPADSGSE